MTDNYDAFDAAMDAEPVSGPRTQFGEIQLDAWPVILRKGEGKVPFDAGQHSTDDRRTAIKIILIPTKGDYNIERELIAESAEWAKIIKPSLRALNTDLRGIDGKFAQVQMVPSGRKYKDKQTGEEKEASTFKFIAIYPGLDECLAAAEEFFSHRGGTNGTAPAPATPESNGNGAANGAERETAAKFLPAMWNMAGKDLVKFSELLASGKFPLVAKYFSLDSPEIVSLVS